MSELSDNPDVRFFVVEERTVHRYPMTKGVDLEGLSTPSSTRQSFVETEEISRRPFTKEELEDVSNQVSWELDWHQEIDVEREAKRAKRSKKIDQLIPIGTVNFAANSIGLYAATEGRGAERIFGLAFGALTIAWGIYEYRRGGEARNHAEERAVESAKRENVKRRKLLDVKAAAERQLNAAADSQ